MITTGLPRVLVCGSRGWTDRALIERVLRAHGPAVIVHGAARGGDRIAAGVAERLGWPVEPHPADWRRHGKSAGPRRNLAMLDRHPVLVIAFTLLPGGTPGTRHTLTNAYRRGIPVVIVTPDGDIAIHTPRSRTANGGEVPTPRPPATRRSSPRRHSHPTQKETQHDPQGSRSRRTVVPRRR
jgi:hypothetical protein